MIERVDRTAGTGWEYQSLDAKIAPGLHDHYSYSPFDDDGDDERDQELPPMEPLPTYSALGIVLAIGALGFSLCVGIALMGAALMPALK